MTNETLFKIGFAAYSGTGKTELLTQLIPLLTGEGLRVAVIKHAHHNFDVDQPGKDSHRMRMAGASEVLVSSSRRWALIHELAENEEEAQLPTLLDKIERDSVDLVLVEGFKHGTHPKIELHRPSLGHPYLYPEDPHIVALASDEAPPPGLELPHLNLNDPAEIALFIQARLQS